jgi:hypothetical protein
MRCKSREEPCGSHHVEARALKCDTSVGLTDDVVLCERNWFRTNRGEAKRRRFRLRRDVGRSGVDVAIVVQLTGYLLCRCGLIMERKDSPSMTPKSLMIQLCHSFVSECSC